MRDDVVLRKLTADGDGIGDEKKMQMVLNVIRSASKGKSSKQDALRAMKMLDALELNAEKQGVVSEMCSKQSQDYDRLAAEIDEQMKVSMDAMERAKVELAAAKEIRRNRQEYNLLVKMIEELPSRADTHSKLEELTDELQTLAERQKQLEAKLNERRNNMVAFNIFVENFRQLIEEDEAELTYEPREVDDDKKKEDSVLAPPKSASPPDEGEVR